MEEPSLLSLKPEELLRQAVNDRTRELTERFVNMVYEELKKDASQDRLTFNVEKKNWSHGTVAFERMLKNIVADGYVVGISALAEWPEWMTMRVSGWADRPTEGVYR